MDIDQWRHEEEARAGGFTRIAGVDEAGRGPLAGPVVAAAVILPGGFSPSGIDDSKKLTPKQRCLLYDRIYADADAVGIGVVDPPAIDRINILSAALLAMAMAVKSLSPRPDYLLVDGPYPATVDISQKPLKKGDALSVSIAAASIVAKVTRDRLMHRYHDEFPEYGFARHKGYPTKGHRAAIAANGCCPIHRVSFKGVREFAGQAALDG